MGLAHLLDERRALDGGRELRHQRVAQPLPPRLVVVLGLLEEHRSEWMPAGDERLPAGLDETHLHTYRGAGQLAQRILREGDERLPVVAACSEATCELE